MPGRCCVKGWEVWSRDRGMENQQVSSKDRTVQQSLSRVEEGTAGLCVSPRGAATALPSMRTGTAPGICLLRFLFECVGCGSEV